MISPTPKKSLFGIRKHDGLLNNIARSDINEKISAKEKIESEFLKFVNDSSEDLSIKVNLLDYSLEQKKEYIANAKRLYCSLVAPEVVIVTIDQELSSSFLKKLFVDLAIAPISWFDKFFGFKCHVKLILGLKNYMKRDACLFLKNNEKHDICLLILKCFQRVIQTPRGKSAFFGEPYRPSDSRDGYISDDEILTAFAMCINPHDPQVSVIAMDMMSLVIQEQKCPLDGLNTLLNIEKYRMLRDIFLIIIGFISSDVNDRINMTIVCFLLSLIDSEEFHPTVWMYVAHRIITLNGKSRLENLKVARSDELKRGVETLFVFIEKAEKAFQKFIGTPLADPCYPKRSYAAINPMNERPISKLGILVRSGKTGLQKKEINTQENGLLRIFQELVFIHKSKKSHSFGKINKTIQLMMFARYLKKCYPDMTMVEVFKRSFHVILDNPNHIKLNCKSQLMNEWKRTSSFVSGHEFMDSVALSFVNGELYESQTISEQSCQTLSMIFEDFLETNYKEMGITENNRKESTCTNSNSSSIISNQSSLLMPPPPPPPPPLMNVGILPPPPPPPPGLIPKGKTQNIEEPKKVNISPPEKVKPIYWNKLPDKVAKTTVWKNIDDEKIHINEDLVLKLFRVKERETPKTPIIKEVVPKKISIVNAERDKAIKIMLAKVKIAPKEIANSIRILSKSINEEQLNSISKVLPTPTEIKEISEFTGDISQLSLSDQYFLEFSTIPGYQKRVDLMILRYQAPLLISSVETPINTILRALDSIKNSKSLKIILSLALKIGNTLNGGTSRGGAFGFKLTSLLKFADIKSHDQTTSLLHFIIKTIEDNYSDALNLPKELEDIPEASKIEIDFLKSSFGPIKSRFTSILQNAYLGSEYLEVANELTKECQEKIDKLSNSIELLEQKSKEIMDLFAEDPTRKIADLFCDLNCFIEQFISTHKHIITKRAEEEKARKQSENKKRITQGPAIRHERGIADELLQRIKVGQLRRVE